MNERLIATAQAVLSMAARHPVSTPADLLAVVAMVLDAGADLELAGCPTGDLAAVSNKKRPSEYPQLDVEMLLSRATQGVEEETDRTCKGREEKGK